MNSNAAGCINWIDENIFMENMAEVLADRGLIVIYDFGITDRMVGNEDYTRWYQNEYLNRFPKPPRKENIWTQKDLPNGFVMEKQTEYNMEYTFGLEHFADFMLIQSNVNARIENGSTTTDQVKSWMMETLAPVFEGDSKRLIFYGYSWYIRNKST